MIGLQELVINRNIKVIEMAKEIGIAPGSIWRWFQVNKVPKQYWDFLENKFCIDRNYISSIVNDINLNHPKKKGFCNPYTIIDDYVVLHIKRKSDGVCLESYIDLEDLPRLIEWDLPWSAVYLPDVDNYYLKASASEGEPGHKKQVIHHLHIDLMNTPEGMCVDHEDHNTLNNRKYNLRVVERDKNSSNRDGANKNSGTGVRNVHLVTRYDLFAFMSDMRLS